MRLDPFVRDYRTYIDELNDALTSKDTRIYLDTSLLMWLLALGAQARAEFFSWCQSRQVGAIRIPVWAAHELHRHVISGTVRDNTRATLNETQRKYAEFTSMATERADDGVCRSKGYPGRSSYVGELEKSLAVLGNLARVVQPDDDTLRAATEEVIGFVNNHLLLSDLNPVVGELSVTGEFRFAHRMPPGFEDKKEENAFGDAIIWEEIIRDVHEATKTSVGTPVHAVIVSRDQKRDWVSSAPYIRNTFGGTQKPFQDVELDVMLPHPLLVHEFVTRAGGDRLYVVHPAFLAAALHRDARKHNRSSAVDQWLAASHRSEHLARITEPDRVKGGKQGRATTDIPSGSAASVRSIDSGDATSYASTPSDLGPVEDFSSETPSTVMAPKVGADVKQFMDALPREHASLLDSALESLLRAERSSFAFGRILAELSLERVVGWPEQLLAMLELLSSRLSRNDLNGVALASLTSVYFDLYGQALDRPMAALGAVCLMLESDPRLKPAFRCLNRFLVEADIKLPYTPGGDVRSVRFVIDVVPGPGQDPKLIRDIRIGQQPVLVDPLPTDSTRRLTALLGRKAVDGCNGLELRSLLAREYLIPMGALTGEQDKKVFTWAADAGLAVIDTGVEGGVSAGADEENHDE